jgi:hypothetical protein
MRSSEDLFFSDDEPQLWTCKKCSNHNIDIKRNCCKCEKNKYNQDNDEAQKAKEKQ